MKKYTFLIKPALFIFNLVFATWMVFAIEKIRPSDFGRYGDIFDTRQPSAMELINKKKLVKLCKDYKAGNFDSLQLEEKIDRLLKLSRKSADKQ